MGSWVGFAEVQSLSTCRCEALPCPWARTPEAGGEGMVRKHEHPSFKNIYPASENVSNCSPRDQRADSAIAFNILLLLEVLLLIVPCTVVSLLG